MKKADVKIILIVLAAVVCISFFVWFFALRKEGASVIVQVDGETYGTYSLNKDQVIEINDTNVLTISDGEAYMSEASCPDKLCIYQGRISQNAQMIVCLPNRVYVQVKDTDEKD